MLPFLKNPSHPEYTFTTDSGVMCLDFHPQHSSLLVAGLYDGSVLVYDIRNKVNRPIRQCDVKTGKHTDPVWQVKWQAQDLSEKNLSFYSVSSDGRVTLWTMSKSELAYQDVMELKLVTNPGEENADDDARRSVPSPADAASTLTSSRTISSSSARRRATCISAARRTTRSTWRRIRATTWRYTARWNTHHPRVFIASADWTVKLWEHGVAKPALSFDLNNAVGDVAWSPNSLTTFAAVTSDGKVHVFDLHENKHEPMCEQKECARRSSPRWRSTRSIPSYWWATIGDASPRSSSPRTCARGPTTSSDSRLSSTWLSRGTRRMRKSDPRRVGVGAAAPRPREGVPTVQ